MQRRSEGSWRANPHKAGDILGRNEIKMTKPLREIALQSAVPEAMVVRKPGFGGFREFRQGLVDYYRDTRDGYGG